MKNQFQIGQKVIKTSGLWYGGEVKIKQIFPDVSELVVENLFGFIDRVTFWDVRPVVES